jgi:broad specificity phosphatase PhoE
MDLIAPKDSWNSTPIVLGTLREYINHSDREVTVDLRRNDFPQMRWEEFDSSVSSLIFNDEQNEEFLNRIHAAYNRLNDQSVVVTHGLPALALIRVATGKGDSVPIWDHSVDNASLTLIKNGRLIWHGRNLYHEVDFDPFENMRPFDKADLLIP